MRQPIWIDCDPGVDDALALLMAHRLDTLKITGISTLSGNVALEKTTRNALALCDLMGASYPVYRGADAPLRRPRHDASRFHGAEGLGEASLPAPARTAEAEAAWDAIYRAAQAHAGKLEIAALGPLTNLATAFVKYPKLSELVRRIVIMGGAAVGGNRTPCAEFNIYADPDAAQIVFTSGIPIVMCGLDVTEKAYLTPEEIESAASGSTSVGEFIRNSTRTAMRLNMQAGAGGLCVHDACPLLYLVRPDLFEGEDAGVYVETRGTITLGKTVTDLYSDFQFEKKNAFVVQNLDRTAFAQILTDALRSY